MIVGIDANEANVETKVGISEYAFQLLTEFNKMQPHGITFEVYVKDMPRDDMPEESDRWHYRSFGPKKLWTQWRLPLDLYTHQPQPDIFFTPSHYAPRFSPVPTVISIMDLSYLRFPELFNPHDLYQLKNWTKYSVRKAKAVLTISQATKDDIINQYDIAEEQVHVIYPGIKTALVPVHHKMSMDETRKKYSIGDKYILFVGTLQPRKNIERLIEAFAKIVAEKKHTELQLVIVGKKGWLFEPILAAPEKYGVSDKVKFLDYVPDSALPALYQNALCYVLPSLYEGFGLPVLEAMKYDCPVITSNISSLPEAGGDAALYIDPTDVSNISETIKKVIENDKLQKEMIAKGRNQVAKFSWEKAAKETLNILQSVAEK